MQDVNYGKLTSMHFHAWSKGLKTGMYYLRTKPATDAIKFTVDAEVLKAEIEQDRKLKAREEAKSSFSTGFSTPARVGSSALLERAAALSVDTPTAKADLSFGSPLSPTSRLGNPLSPASPASPLMAGSMSPPDSPLITPMKLEAKRPASGSLPLPSVLQGSPMQDATPVKATSTTTASPSSPDVSISAADLAEAEARRAERERQKEAMYCSLTNKEACLSCGS